MRLGRIIFIIIFLVFIQNSYAAKVYKIIDEDGKVTYSQFPPKPKESAGKKVEDVKLTNAESPMSRITTQLNDQYCGQIKLPKQKKYKSSSLKYYSKNVIQSQQNWQRSLDRLEGGMEQRRQKKFSSTKNNSRYSNQSKNDAHFNERYQQDTKRMLDLRCAIKWSHEEIAKFDSYSNTDNAEKTRLERVYSTLQNNLDSACGEQPALDPTNPKNKRNRRQWYDCSKSYIADMKRVRRELNRL